MDKKNKITNRLQAIAELIKSQQIEDQATLVQLIKEKYGIETNQAVVSRDLRQMGASKHQVGSKMVYELKNVDASKEILRLAVTDVDHNETLIIIKTLPGMAGFVAEFIDMHDDLDIIGTIAGENTVFVAPQSVKKIKEVYEAMCNVLYINSGLK